MRTPRLVATDLDGTLLHSDGTVTDGTRRVLQELDARGVPVVFTTGRPIRWMESLWDDEQGFTGNGWEEENHEGTKTLREMRRRRLDMREPALE